MVLTDDGKLQARIADPRYQKTKTYLAQVERIPERKALVNLRRGIALKDGVTAPAKVRAIEQPDWIWPRFPPIRERREIPTQWLCIEISEGRNRQIRRMTAAVGHPTLRLVRVAIADWRLEGLQPGSWRQL